MGFSIKCEGCGARMPVDPALVGQQMSCPECGMNFTVPMTCLTPGMVEGNYWIQKSLGSGDISEVFLAKKVSDNEKVFLKVLSPAVTGNKAVVEYFLNEMRRSQEIEHPSVVTVLEAGEISGHYFVAQPYIEGECLDVRIARDGPMKERDALKVIIRVARALRYAWENHNTAHRAVKPANILLDADSEPFLLDFGNPKQVLAAGGLTLDHLNQAGTVADYMSPEQAQGWYELDCRSDIYSLGATLFYLLTGAKPYTGTNTTQVLQKHLTAPVPNPCKRNQDVSEEAAAFLRTMMAKNPDNRFQSWGKVIGQLKELLKALHHPGATTQMILNTQQFHVPRPRTATTPPIPAPLRQKTAVMPIVLLCVIVLLLVGGLIGGFLLLRPKSPAPPIHEPPRVEETTPRPKPTEKVVTPPKTVTKPKKKDRLQRQYERLDKQYTRKHLTEHPKKFRDAIESYEKLLKQAAGTKHEKTLKGRVTKLKKLQAEIMAAAFGGPVATVKETPAPKGPVESKLYQDFLFLGPFENNAKTAVWKAIKPVSERSFPDFTKKIKHKDRTLAWTRYFRTLNYGKVEMRGLMKPGEKGFTYAKDNVHAYAAVKIFADTKTEARLMLGGDDDLTVWLNGQQVHQHQGTANQDSAKVNITLDEGRNVLILGTVNNTGNWWFSFRLTEPETMNSPPGVTISCPKKP